MERLTIRNSEGLGVLKQPYQCERCGDLQWSLPDLGNGSPTDRLAEYEDIGLSPVQIKEVDRLYAEKCKELTELQRSYLSGMELAQIWAGMEKLKEYRRLEEQGKLLRLPCAVGDTIYVIPSNVNYKLNIISGHSENNRVYEQVVDRIEIGKYGYLLSTCDGMASVVEESYKATWFLTREEAEAALKKQGHVRKNEID